MKAIGLAVLLAVLPAGALAADERKPAETSTDDATKLDEEKQSWPKTVDEAVARILSKMAEKEKQMVRDTPKEELIRFHHGWGTGIRNSFGLWRGNRALMDDCKAKHPDEASMVIIEAVWLRLQKEKNVAGEQKRQTGGGQ